MRNIELKARLEDFERAHAVCHSLGASLQGKILQTDTYFPVRSGRLKLRQCDPGEDYLVYYRRPDAAETKRSDYSIVRVQTGNLPLRTGDTERVAVVRKVRELWLWENVRIHLDQVQGLGQFIEFEAVLSPQHDEEDGFQKISYLKDAFGIAEQAILGRSYADMVPPA